MPRAKDKTAICWQDPQGNIILEDIYTYNQIDDEEEAVDEPTSELSYEALHLEQFSIDKLLLILIIDDALEKLGILRCTAQLEHPPLAYKIPEYKTIDERFGQLTEFDDNELSESKKRYTDLTVIYSIMYRTLEDLGTNGSYSPLGEATRIIKKLHEDEEKLYHDAEEGCKLEEELKKKLKSQKKELDTEYNAKLETLRLLELQHEDAIAYGKLEYKYLENWESARRHQAHVLQEREENSYRDIIENNKTQIELENRIHGELLKFFEENAEELNNDIQYWMYRYESEIESRDAELLKLRMDREAQMEKYDQLKATYETQSEFIDYWWGIKEERRLAEEFEQLKHVAATKIQAWWRGLMVRLRLGPFKKKKRGKGKDDKKKKKKK